MSIAKNVTLTSFSAGQVISEVNVNTNYTNLRTKLYEVIDLLNTISGGSTVALATEATLQSVLTKLTTMHSLTNTKLTNISSEVKKIQGQGLQTRVNVYSSAKATLTAGMSTLGTRRSISIKNLSNSTAFGSSASYYMYVGFTSTTLTSANGWPIAAGEIMTFDATLPLYAISSASTGKYCASAIMEVK